MAEPRDEKYIALRILDYSLTKMIKQEHDVLAACPHVDRTLSWQLKKHMTELHSYDNTVGGQLKLYDISNEKKDTPGYYHNSPAYFRPGRYRRDKKGDDYDNTPSYYNPGRVVEDYYDDHRTSHQNMLDEFDNIYDYDDDRDPFAA
jgi:hypothetical protein